MWWSSKKEPIKQEMDITAKCQMIDSWGRTVIDRFYAELPRSPDGKSLEYLDREAALSLLAKLWQETIPERGFEP